MCIKGLACEKCTLYLCDCDFALVDAEDRERIELVLSNMLNSIIQVSKYSTQVQFQFYPM
jgi:hypothetical protein